MLDEEKPASHDPPKRRKGKKVEDGERREKSKEVKKKAKWMK